MSNTGTPPRIRHYQSFTSPGKIPSVNLKEPKLAKFILSAEFDNRSGSLIRHQIPKKIPGSKEYLSHLGELMIPNNSEHSRKEDFSLFILYKDLSGKYQLFQDDYEETVVGEDLGFQHMSLNEINTIFENKSHDDDILFFYTVTKTIEDSTDDRGAKIRSIAVGTPIPNFVVFKHLLTITIQNFIMDNQLSHLISLFNTINGIDITLWRNFGQQHSRLQQLLSLNFDLSSQLIFPKLKQLLLSNDIQTDGIRYKSGSLQYYSTHIIEDPTDRILSRIPINMSLTSPQLTVQSDLNLTFSILQFLHKLADKINSTEYKNFNIVIYSESNTDQLCQFVLSLSNFFNGFNKAYFNNDKILYFPLIDLYNFDTLIKYDSKFHNTKIVGTNNIIIKENIEFYDFWYDLSTEELIMNDQKLEIFDVTISKTQDFMDLTKALLNGHHDFNTTLVTMQRFNLWEIIKILKRDDSESEVNLKDYYLKRNKNLILFDWFFEFKIIRLIDTLSQFFIEISKDEFDVDLICEYLDYMIQFLIGNVKGHLETFIHTVEIFPIGVKKMYDLIYFGDDNEEQKSGFNFLFKGILFDDIKLQSKVLRLYKLLSNSDLSLIIDKKLNVTLMISLEEFASGVKNGTT